LYLQTIDFLGMDTRFLETLVTVVECGSLAEAARRLNLTASAVAQRIQALETEIGISLLARSGRTVHPATAAVAVLERARTIQREIRDLKSVAASGILSGELRLGVVPSMLTGFVPDVLAGFSTSHHKSSCALPAAIRLKCTGTSWRSEPTSPLRANRPL
jgi:DNA-binding transcriptional LysR family regulator